MRSPRIICGVTLADRIQNEGRDSPASRAERTLEFGMDKPLSREDMAAMEEQLRHSVDEDRRRSRVNDVKCDAIHTARTYEEFADRVAAAHLRPLDKGDWKNTGRGWNQYSRKKEDV